MATLKNMVKKTIGERCRRATLDIIRRARNVKTKRTRHRGVQNKRVGKINKRSDTRSPVLYVRVSVRAAAAKRTRPV